MIVQETWTGIDFGVLLGGVFDGMKPFLPILIPFIVLIIILAVPLPGRGLGFQPRDPWRSFKFEARRVVLTLAGSRCEGPLFFAWGRCGKRAEEVDHVSTPDKAARADWTARRRLVSPDVPRVRRRRRARR